MKFVYQELPKPGELQKPIIVFPKSEWKRFNKTWLGYKLPLLAISTAGRLGNVMSTYASIIAISNAYKVRLNKISKDIDTFTIKEIFHEIQIEIIKINIEYLICSN